jgi:hypothetical protein
MSGEGCASGKWRVQAGQMEWTLVFVPIDPISLSEGFGRGVEKKIRKSLHFSLRNDKFNLETEEGSEHVVVS